jgi:EAL domain-containing protein (putative c-di-GMP-specific phosphodiesterase class I)/GGDEF domain-containing protein
MRHAKPAPLTDSAPRDEVLARAQSLLEELEPVNRAQAQMSSRATAWVVAGISCIMAFFALESGLSYLRGTGGLKAPWIPFYGLLLLSLVAVYFWRRPEVSARAGLVVTALLGLSYLIAMAFNGHMTVYALGMAVAFIHISAPPNIALAVSLVFLGAATWTLSGSNEVTPTAAVRLIGGSCIALLVVQFLSRQNRRLSEVAQGVTKGLRSMAEGLGGELLLARQERDLAARTDPQTGLLNARAFEDALAQGLTGPDAAAPGVLVALRFDRLDEFIAPLAPSEQRVFLNLLVARLTDSLGARDQGRLGKWEFAGWIPLQGPDAPEGPHRARQERFVNQWARLWQPVTFGSRTVPLQPRLGVVRAPQDGDSATELLRRAEIALMMADSLRSAAPVWFDTHMEAALADRAQMSQAIERALRDDEFELVYHPIAGLRGEPLRKAEALIRWNDPVKGRISPADFIPLAESYGKIVPLTSWVLKRAAAQVRPWRESLDPAFQISVNMPPAYLEWCVDHLADALQALSALQVPAGSIVLEITEGAFLNVTPEVLQVLALLKGMGFGVALDDFGVGYSSFGQLDRLPLDTLKIDKSLVDHIEATPTKRAVCAAIIKVGQELGCKVVAEGVETAGQQALLAQAGCDFVQGYLIARPMSAADFESFVRR